jgi:hypothetical protein
MVLSVPGITEAKLRVLLKNALTRYVAARETLIISNTQASHSWKEVIHEKCKFTSIQSTHNMVKK